MQTFNTTNQWNKKCSFKDCIHDPVEVVKYPLNLQGYVILLCQKHLNHADYMYHDIKRNCLEYLTYISDQLLFNY